MAYQCPWSAGAKRCPDLFRQVFSDYAVASFAVGVFTSDDSFAIAFVNSATNVISACVAVVRFASAMVWSCCILVNNAALVSAYFTLAAYPLVLEVLYYLWISLNALLKRASKLLQVFLSLRSRDHSQKSSWYSPHFSMFAYAIETIWAGVYRFYTVTASWLH